MTYLSKITLFFLLILLENSEMSLSSNWAINKPTFQSSVSLGPEHSGTPDKAVDGNVIGDLFVHGCTHTVQEADPWWVVDLGQRITVTHITVVNRVDCCGGSLFCISCVCPYH